MIQAFALASVGKWVKERLTLKNLAILVGVIAICLVIWKFYSWSFERGAAHQLKEDEKVIATLTGERDSWKNKYTAYRSSYKTWAARSEQARKTLDEQNKATVASLELRLKEAKKKQKTTRGLINEIPIYIPTVVDFELSSGFVRLYNLSIEGETGTSTPESDQISGSLAFDVGAPSGTTLSTFATYVVDNNAECVYRGELIRAWQDWYKETKAQFDKAQQEAAESIPRVPDEAPADLSPDTSTTEQPKPIHESS